MNRAEMIGYARAMSSYNRWMNTRLYEACSTLDDADRKQDVGAFFGSIHGTLNHLLLADKIWMGRFGGTPFEFKTLRDELYADFSHLHSERALEDERIATWTESLASEDFDKELVYVSAVNAKMRKYPLWFAVAHFFNHQTHHRGQVTALLSQRGVDPGITDLIWLPEFQGKGVDG